MAYYCGVWKTNNVSVELKIKGSSVTLERTRGAKSKKKQIVLKSSKLGNLVESLVAAYSNEPSRQLASQIPIGIVDGGRGLLRIEWGPYWFGKTNALMIRGQHVGECLAIEQEDLKSFARWVLGQWIAIYGPEQLHLVE